MSLTTMQHDEIIRAYNRQQLQNKHEQNQRVTAIYQQIPRIKEIRDEIAELSLKTTKLLLLNPEATSISEYRHAAARLLDEKQTLLYQHGYSEHDLELHYRCQDCRDTGYIENQKCHCFKAAEIDILYQQSNIKNQLTRENFQTFSYDYFRDDYTDSITGLSPLANIKNVVNICKQYVASFSDKEHQRYSNLMFFGETGVGKTFLTNCIAKELLDRYHSVIYLSSIKFFNILSEAEFHRDNVDARYQLSQLQNCDLLIIDDLGTELPNSFTNSALFNCMNERLLAGKSTIISTNFVFPELMDRYSERITSRLSKEFTFLKIYGDDLRHDKRIKSNKIT